MIGTSYTTGAVHYAIERDGRLVQACGMSRRQLAFLHPTPDAAVTCKRCQGAHAPVSVADAHSCETCTRCHP